MNLEKYPQPKNFKEGYLVPHHNIKIINSSWGSPELKKNGKVKGIQFFLVKRIESMGKGFLGRIKYADDFDEVWIAEILPNWGQIAFDTDQFSFQMPFNWSVKAKFKINEISRIVTIKEINGKKDVTTKQNLFGAAATILTGPFGAAVWAGLYIFKDKEKVVQLGIEFNNGEWVTLFFDKTDKKDLEKLDLTTNLQKTKAPF